MQLFRGKKEDFPLGRFQNPFLELSRTPKDTLWETHKIADDWFLRTFGVAARSTTLMCSTNPSQAYTYGANVRIIKPERPYKLISSPEVDDFLEITRSVRDATCRAEIEAWLESRHYYCVDTVEDLRDDALVEVMVYCKFFTVCQAPGYGPFDA